MNKQELIEKLKTIDGGYGSRYYIAMGDVFELVEQLDEPQKVTVPQFVADWIEYAKFEDYHLLGAMDSIAISGRKNLDEWFRGDDDNMELFARAWLDGYQTQKENRYIVKMKGMNRSSTILKLDKILGSWYLGEDAEYSHTKDAHTRKELEQAGFGWVFDCPGIEIEVLE